MLAERKRAYADRGETLSRYDTQALLPGWKKQRPTLKRVHSLVVQNVNIRVDLAFQAFFRRVKEGAEKVGFPRFKGRGRYTSITYSQYGNGVQLDGERLILSKLGAVHGVLHRPLEGTPKTVTLTRARTGKWYVCFSCEVAAEPLPPTEAVVDVAWSQFISMTLAKAEEAGRQVVLVNPRDTSKLCSSCGELVQKQLSDRTHSCPHCGLVMGRDHNAAINILHRGLQSLRR